MACVVVAEAWEDGEDEAAVVVTSVVVVWAAVVWEEVAVAVVWVAEAASEGAWAGRKVPKGRPKQRAPQRLLCPFPVL